MSAPIVIHICPMFPPPVVGGLEKQALLLNSELSLIGLDSIVLSYSYGCSFFSKGTREDLYISGVFANQSGSTNE